MYLKHYLWRVLRLTVFSIRLGFQSHESRDLVFSLLLRISQPQSSCDDSYVSSHMISSWGLANIGYLQQCTVYMSGNLEKKGSMRWSSRYLSLVQIQSLPNSLNAFKTVKLLVYKHQKDLYPTNSIELRYNNSWLGKTAC